MQKNITVILYPGCIFFEIALATELLARDYQIHYYSPSGDSFRLSNGLTVETKNYSEIDAANTSAFIIPGGEFGSVKDNKIIDEKIVAAHARGIFLAAICGGPFLLGKAGVLAHKKIAHGFNEDQKIILKDYFQGCQMSDEIFVADGNILTAKAENHIDFAVELAIRLGASLARYANRTKEYYRGLLGKRIRPLALAVIENEQGQFLFHHGHDLVKQEYFYRPLGGGIDFFESGAEAVKREMMEELNLEANVFSLMATFENRFVFEGQKGHEIILLYRVTFKDPSAYTRKELEIVESGAAIDKAVWRSLEEIQREKANLYPLGIESYLKK